MNTTLPTIPPPPKPPTDSQRTIIIIRSNLKKIVRAISSSRGNPEGNDIGLVFLGEVFRMEFAMDSIGVAPIGDVHEGFLYFPDIKELPSVYVVRTIKAVLIRLGMEMHFSILVASPGSLVFTPQHVGELCEEGEIITLEYLASKILEHLLRITSQPREAQDFARRLKALLFPDTDNPS